MPSPRLIFAATGFAILLASCANTPPAAPPAAEPSSNAALAFPYVTRHEGTFNGKRIAYTATVGALEVQDSEGKPGARIVTTSYVADTPADAAPRPVMFVYNGGPISPSAYLHMGAFGPKRVAFSEDLSQDPATAPLVDNPWSILDVADLVYFDPAGTGFSQTLPGKDLESYFSVEADGQQTAAFVAAWLKANSKTGSPAYMFGESYGTMRAVEAAGQLAKLPEPVLLYGVVLFGQAVNIIEYAQRPLNIISYAVSLPTLAAIAWYRDKVDKAGYDFEGFVNASWDYARTDYLEALFQGNALPPEQLRQVAEQLEGYSGLPADYWAEKKLRVSKEEYRVELFRDKGLLIGRSDGRYVGPAKSAEEGKPPADPAASMPEALANAFKGYLVSDLGLPSADGYQFESPVKGLDGWGWGGSSPFSRFAYGESMKVLLDANPRCRVFVGNGYQDTMTTTGAARYLVEQEDWPRERTELKFYQGGHMAYSVEESARQLADDLRAFIRGTE